jgi:hypothetical protein
VAGNGGEVAEALQVLSADVTSEKTSSMTKGRRPERASRGKGARKSGAERLRQLADKRVGRHSKELADLLTGKALAGDLANIRVLVGLAERKEPEPEPVKKKRWPTFAMELAADAPWEGEGEKCWTDVGEEGWGRNRG